MLPDRASSVTPRQPPRVVRFQDVHDRAATYLPAKDLRRIQQAYVFCARAHEGQSRLSGEPYLVHPMAVAEILADMKLDAVTVTAGLLHDVLEDTAVEPEEIERLFGAEVAHVVDGVTKLSKLAFSTKEEVQAESFRKMILAMADDLRVILVKLADRLHNMRTLAYLPEEKRASIARETLEIYAPIARRLGMGRLRDELEELAFRHAEPERYRHLAEQLEQRSHRDEDFTRRTEERLRAVLAQAGIAGTVTGRRKSLASIHRKVEVRDIDVAEVYDYLAFRIVTKSVPDCYAALGVIHAAWTPIQARFKDFIATPKPNGYRSLHTTLVGDTGHPFEVQIRTEEMHLVSEEGVAAHWGYKEGKTPTASEVEAFAWLRNLLDAQKDHADPHEFMQAVKLDLYGDEVYCFTPKGEVKVLPAGSTPIDFAYAIHTEVGNHCVGARIDGELVPLRNRLAHGNRVEILTQPSQHPRRDWLQHAATSRARSKIRQWFNAHDRETAIETGRAMLEREARKVGTTARRVLQSKGAHEALKAAGYREVDDFLVALAHDRAQPSALLSRLGLGKDAAAPAEAPATTRPERAESRRRAKARQPLVSAGEGPLLTFLARCCGPVRGEPIVGYVTRGRGVSVHRQGCPSLGAVKDGVERRLDVAWNAEAEGTCDARLRMEVADRPGMLGDVTSTLSELGVNIKSASARATSSGRGAITLSVEVRDVEQLNQVKRALARIDGVLRVER